MSLWEKIRTEIQEGAKTLAAKAPEWLKSGADAVKIAAEKAATKAAYATKLAQLNWEHHNIQSLIEIEQRRLGALLFKLQAENRLTDLEREAAAHFEKLAALEEDLANNEQQKQELPKTYGLETIDKESIQELTKDLEAGGGTIVQVTLAEGSPIAGKKLKEVELPKEALVGTIVRNDQILIPDGETVFQAGDKISLLGKREDVESAVTLMAPQREME
jgi:K+/H+ antiporter YhaU regulatory subunit KhtT